MNSIDFHFLYHHEHDKKRGCEITVSTEKEKGPETILIVDDDSEIREILRILLCRNGFIVKEAADAKEALLKLDSSIDFFFC